MAEIHNINSAKSGRETPREAVPRRLAAIVAGDIAGYSRHMQIDEEGTHARMKRLERELIEPSIVEHHGKLVKTTGDGFLAIFDSPVEAARCVEADDVYGDGVNIATRLEGIADPGQVHILGGIYEQIKHKLVCGYESLGDRKVKNITDPVRVYRVVPDATAFNPVRKRRESVLILLSLTLLVIASGVLWYLLVQPRSQVAHQMLTPGSAPARSGPAG